MPKSLDFSENLCTVLSGKVRVERVSQRAGQKFHSGPDAGEHVAFGSGTSGAFLLGLCLHSY